MTWPQVSGIDALRHLMEANDLSHGDLARILDTPRSHISELLSGKRGLSKAHIQKLAASFGLSADVFLDRQPA